MSSFENILDDLEPIKQETESLVSNLESNYSTKEALKSIHQDAVDQDTSLLSEESNKDIDSAIDKTNESIQAPMAQVVLEHDSTEHSVHELHTLHQEPALDFMDLPTEPNSPTKQDIPKLLERNIIFIFISHRNNTFTKSCITYSIVFKSNTHHNPQIKSFQTHKIKSYYDS